MLKSGKIAKMRGDYCHSGLPEGEMAKKGVGIAISGKNGKKQGSELLLHPFEELDKGRVIDCDPLHHAGSEHRDGVLVGPEAGIVVIDTGNY